MTDADPKAIAYAAAFVGAAVSLVTAVLVTWLNDRSEARRQREGAAREDRREAERAERASRKRLDDLRRVECVRLMSAATLVVQMCAVKDNLTTENSTRFMAAQIDLPEAAEAVQLFGPGHLALAASKVAEFAQRYRNSEGRDREVFSDYESALAELKKAAREALRYPG